MSPFALRMLIYVVLGVVLLVSGLMVIRKRRGQADGWSEPQRQSDPPRGYQSEPLVDQSVKDAFETANTPPQDLGPVVKDMADSVREMASESGSSEPVTSTPAEAERAASEQVQPATPERVVSRQPIEPLSTSLPETRLRPAPIDEAVEPLEAADLPHTRKDDFAYGALTPTLASMLPESDERRREVKSELKAAGYYEPHAYENLSATRTLGILVPLVLLLALLFAVPESLEWLVIGLIVMVPIMGWALPRLFVRGQATERKAEIERAMPDMLDMVNMCVSQGLTVPHALERVAHELRDTYPALSQELRIVVDQAEMYDLPTALDNFARRIDVPEVHSFASLIIQTERMGTSVSAALIEYSDNMRESLRQRADEKANRATFKLLFPTVLCLMPAVYLFLLGPAIIELSDFFGGGGGSEVFQNTTRATRALNQ